MCAHVFVWKTHKSLQILWSRNNSHYLIIQSISLIDRLIELHSTHTLGGGKENGGGEKVTETIRLYLTPDPSRTKTQNDWKKTNINTYFMFQNFILWV